MSHRLAQVSNGFSSDTAIGLVAALVPGVITVVIAALGYADRTRATAERREIRESERYQKVVLEALGYFTHGTQRRNVGISALQQLVMDSRAGEDFPTEWYRPLADSFDRRLQEPVTAKGVTVSKTDLATWRAGLSASGSALPAAGGT